MMEAFNFLFFSIIEGIAILTFMLTLFRFNPRYYLMPILVLSVVTSVSSYMFRMHWPMTYLDPFVQLAIVIVGMMWILEVNIILAVLISFLGYIGYGFIQTFILLLFKVIGVEIKQTSYHFAGILFSVSTSFIVLLLSWFIFRKGWGFTFSFRKIKNIRELTLFVSIILLAIAAIATVLLSLFHGLDNLYLFLTLFLCSLVILLFFALRKERRND